LLQVGRTDVIEVAHSDQSAEDRLIARHFAPLAKHPGAFGLTDDAAVLAPPEGSDVVLKADAVIGGVHFFPDDPADAVAAKALRVNLSDLAAKGAEPAGFLLSLALPAGVGEDWLAAFARGLAADAERYRCPLMGGDTDRTPGPVTVSIAAFGLVPRGAMVRRSSAKAGDAVVVTGTIGDAALGLRLRKEPERAARWGLDAASAEHLARRYLLPEPRNAIALAVRRHASAAMDVSDGLVGDLAKLCRVSGVGAEVSAARVPLSQAARAAIAAEPALLAAALTGGDDYEVLCTMAPERVASFSAAGAAAGVPATEIGRIVAGAGVRFFDAEGRALTFAQAAYSHF
jgi:thiamine-monophosphate kinase